MKRLLILVCSVVFLFGTVGLEKASALNIALNSTVTLHGGTFFTDGSWTGDIPAAPSTIVDGVFLDLHHQWNKDTVFWDSHDDNDNGQYIKIDLGGVFNIDSFIAQVDDNDAYILSYWNMTLSTWETVWDIPNYTSDNWGMTTRPDPFNNLLAFNIGSQITTNALKLEGNLVDGDKYFAVSEIQAFGAPVPEPATMLLFGLGLLGLAGVSRKKQK